MCQQTDAFHMLRPVDGTFARFASDGADRRFQIPRV
jgi:hypothetical protein